MKIVSVYGQDFLPLGEVVFGLSDKGLLHLHGVNEDDTAAKSNGAGKSSLFDLLMWVLYGETMRGEAGDQVIRSGAKSAAGTVVLDDDGQTYSIYRSRKKGSETLRLAQSPSTDLTKGTVKLTQAEIIRVIGCNEEIFRGSIYAGQEQLVDLPLMTDKALKLTIEQAAGIDILERAYEAARERVRKAQSDLTTASNRVGHAQASIISAVSALHSQQVGKTSWEGKQAEHAGEIDKEIETVESNITNISAELASVPSREVIEIRLQVLRDKLASFKSEADERSRLQRDLDSAEWACSNGETVRLQHMRQFSVLHANCDKVGDRIGESCSECGTPLTPAHLADVQAAAKKRVEDAAKLGSEHTATLPALALARNAARDALAAYVSTMTDPSEVADKANKLSALHQSIIDKTDRRANELKRRETLVSNRDFLASTINPFIAGEVVALASLEEKRAEEKGALREEGEAKTDLEHAVGAAAVFSPSGVRAHILDQVTPFLNVRTAEYLSSLTDGAITAAWSTLTANSKGELKERFAIDVTHAVTERGFRSLSGGEKRKVRIACALALQDLVKSRASKPIDLFIADEVDTALDSAGLERLMVVLQERVKTSGTVMVISHNDLRDYIPNTWTVTKKGGVSTLAI